MNNQITKSSFSILFVDDEEKSRKYFCKGLQDNFTILTAENVKEAQKIIEENHQEIAAVITDQRMPGDNGVKLLQYLRQNHPNIVRLLTTAHSDLSEAIQAVNTGEIFRYIQKPWDYNLLKTDLNQAVELFELRFERNALLQEKIMIKKKMTKIDRVRSLILLARTLNFIHFADLSIEHFIRQFALNHQNDDELPQDWQSFELGNADLLETLFLIDVIDTVYSKIPNSYDYNFDKIINNQQLTVLIQEAAKDQGIAFEVKQLNEIQDLEINDFSFKTAVKQLLSQIAPLSKEKIIITIDKISDSKVVIDINAKAELPKNSNIFFVSSKESKKDLYVNLLICYLLIGHHGGNIDIKSNPQSINFRIEIPSNPKQTKLPNRLTEESLENLLLTVILD